MTIVRIACLAMLIAFSGCNRNEKGAEEAEATQAAVASAEASAAMDTSQPTQAAAPLPAAAKNSSEYCATNQDEWVNGCSASCVAGWEGSNCPNSCTATPPPGFVLLDHRDINVSENNGGASISVIPADSRFDYKLSLTNAYKAAIDAAGNDGNKELAAQLTDEMNRSLTIAESFSSTNQMVRLSVDASKHGSFFDRKRGWSDHRVELKIRCVVPGDLQQKLYEKYGLK